MKGSAATFLNVITRINKLRNILAKTKHIITRPALRSGLDVLPGQLYVCHSKANVHLK